MLKTDFSYYRKTAIFNTFYLLLKTNNTFTQILPKANSTAQSHVTKVKDTKPCGIGNFSYPTFSHPILCNDQNNAPKL